MIREEAISTVSGRFLALEYLYRDASNYKSFGSVWLAGILTDSEVTEILSSLEGGEFFVAEQVGLPTLYAALFHFGEGPTEDDHAWHTLECLRREEELGEGVTVWGTFAEVLDAFRAARGKWRPEMSPNFN